MPPAPDQILRQHHRHLRGTLLVWALACALLAAGCAGAARLGWWSQALLPGGLLALATLACLSVWFVRARRLTRESIARRLDAEWHLSSRLESSHEVAADRTAFAAALRADASAHVAARKLPASPWWHAGLALLVLGLLLGVVESGILGWRFLASLSAGTPPAPAADISATIDWRKPDSEIKATAIEEIPLVAQAVTATGFRRVTLEISVNGGPSLSRPLPPALLQALAKPGTHPVELPLYLDEIEAQPFDIVAYHLRADRLTPAPAPVVTSPLQFIQIRPAREDVEIRRLTAGGPPPPVFELAALIGSLKAAQLALLKQNFLLAHAPLAKTDPVWAGENTRVAADQSTFADKVVEARALAIKIELPALVVDNLTQIEPLARDASALIAKTENEPATPLQGRSLGLVTELEKLLRKILLDIEGAAKAAKKPEPENPDPFKDGQKFRLPPRKLTGAGQLEDLAEKQSEQTKENEKAPDGSPSQQSAADKQAELAKKLAELAAAKKLQAAAQKAAEAAARDAQKAAEHLNKGDSAAARSPAAAAAQALKEGVDAQEKAGREAALAQLDAARRALNDAARIPDAAARAARLAEIARQLHEEARAQQESGSAEAARQLEAAALAAQKASEAAAQGRDRQPAPGPGPGPKPGLQPGDKNGGDKPGDKPGSSDRPGSGQPAPGKGDLPVPDPSGDRTARGSGAEPGKTPGPEKDAGQEKSPGPGKGEGGEPKPGEAKDSAQGEGPGTVPGTRPGGSGDSAPVTLPGPGSGSGSGNQPGQNAGATPLENATEAAAHAEAVLAGYRASLERALRQIESAQGSGPGTAQKEGSGPGTATDPSAKSSSPSGPGGARPLGPRDRANLQLAAQLADALLRTSQADGLRRQLEKDLRPFDADGNVVMPAELFTAVDQLRVLLEAALGSARRDEIVRRYNPDDIPPAYREAVERYFEQLSRGAK